MERPGDLGPDGRTLAKYLHTVSAAALRSWLKGHAEPAWQAPWRKNLHGTCDVSGKEQCALAHRRHFGVFVARSIILRGYWMVPGALIPVVLTTTTKK